MQKKPQQAADIELRLLVEAIFLRYSHDFRDYSVASLKRRVLHAQEQLGYATISEMQERILRDPNAFGRLMSFLTVPVSDMFRDPSYFLALRSQVVPVLRTYASVKIWVAGCCTGEEVYSLAILLREEGLLDRTIIYATDINPDSLDTARQGILPLERVSNYTANYQQAGGTRSFSDYYTAAYERAIFDKTLRENITFADHSLSTDAVFSETQFISCRNVLIYFNRALQDRALGLFYESLSHRGFLGLGSRETLEFSAWRNRFEVLSKPERLWRKL
jgi:chemotaxis protein methyltransferase CheR